MASLPRLKKTVDLERKLPIKRVRFEALGPGSCFSGAFQPSTRRDDPSSGGSEMRHFSAGNHGDSKTDARFFEIGAPIRRAVIAESPARVHGNDHR
jgi:hypothetical protein